MDAMSLAIILYSGFLMSMFTLWLARGRPLWGEIAQIAWMLMCFVFACGVNEATGSYAIVRPMLILLFAGLLIHCLVRVRRLEISDARRWRPRDRS